MTARVVVTGAANGIGRGVAEAAAQRGDQLFLVDLDGEAVAAVAEEIGAAGWAACDVSDPDAVDAAAERAWATMDGVDLVVHAAGVSVAGPVLGASPADLRFVTDVNVLGTYFVVQSFARRLVAQESPSRLVLVGSEHSLGVPHLYSAAYTASKHAILGYADVLRRELPEHVRVSVLCPGLVATELWRSPERRGAAYGGPQEVPASGGAMMASGMPVSEIAEAVFRGIDEDEFLIVTHGHARRHARERFREVDSAFDRQAPDEGDDRYDIGRLVPQMAP
jgi:NAD(P)-dependent dehydrogenase (short-subunit alcohol dehydrogenase family)